MVYMLTMAIPDVKILAIRLVAIGFKFIFQMEPTSKVQEVEV